MLYVGPSEGGAARTRRPPHEALPLTRLLSAWREWLGRRSELLEPAASGELPLLSPERDARFHNGAQRIARLERASPDCPSEMA